MEAKFEYTQNLKKIFDTRTEKLQSYYSREDITEARNEYIQAPADAKQFRWKDLELSLIHISEPTRRTPISYAVFCLKKKKLKKKKT